MRDTVPAETGASDDIDAFLRKVSVTPQHTAPRTGRRGRMIFALDATASREPTWDTAGHLQGSLFEATRDVGGLDVQLMFYRGFMECKAGRWVGDADALHRQMRKVSCVGGHTQTCRVLRHALKQHGKTAVNALVFVGDALEEDIDDLCHEAGKLGAAGLPCFVFQEGRDPVVTTAFKQVARLSGGAWAPFDLKSAHVLKDLLAAVAVYASGGRAALENHAQTAGDDVLRLTHQLPGAR